MDKKIYARFLIYAYHRSGALLPRGMVNFSLCFNKFRLPWLFVQVQGGAVRNILPAIDALGRGIPCQGLYTAEVSLLSVS
jgi:hypothetical protein